MTTLIDQVTIRVAFIPDALEPPIEEWTFTQVPNSSCESGSPRIDEQELEAELCAVFLDAIGANTLEFRPTLAWGGRGAQGPTVLEIAKYQRGHSLQRSLVCDLSPVSKTSGDTQNRPVVDT
jgi:hypothetical protein